MRLRNLSKSAAAIGAVSLLVIAITSIRPGRVRADDDWDDKDESKIKIGFEVAPVTPNTDHKDKRLVGLGSYLVNVQGDCNGCHSAGPQTEYTSSGNPYLLPPVFSGAKKVNPAAPFCRESGFATPCRTSPGRAARNLCHPRGKLPD